MYWPRYIEPGQSVQIIKRGIFHTFMGLFGDVYAARLQSVDWPFVA
jgi:hypothetical protein